MEILKKIKTRDKLPETEGGYYVITKDNVNSLWFFSPKSPSEWDDIKYWYDPIEIKLKSEEILPLEQRGLFSVCFSSDEVQDYAEELEKALDAAEKEIVKLKDLTSILCEEIRVFNYDAKERYEDALQYCEEKYGIENTNIDNIVIIALKIASGILK